MNKKIVYSSPFVTPGQNPLAPVKPMAKFGDIQALFGIDRAADANPFFKLDARANSELEIKHNLALAPAPLSANDNLQQIGSQRLAVNRF